jgi:hypothetical protein
MLLLWSIATVGRELLAVCVKPSLGWLLQALPHASNADNASHWWGGGSGEGLQSSSEFQYSECCWSCPLLRELLLIL